MIVCPNCKEEIDDDSHFCDQCGQALLYCEKCGRVGMGRRCTSCGGMMLSAEELEKRMVSQDLSSAVSAGFVSQEFMSTNRGESTNRMSGQLRGVQGIPQLLLHNDSLNIRLSGVNGAVIGRKQGPYTQFFQQNMFVSGVHAQLKYNNATGWCITDKHSSNGTKLNDHQLVPDVDMSLKNGDILTIANINLQVNIN
ncbi:MAG: FHA domain-containing protein [Prevotella sp.]|nr:FHA domain-containing protein [Prevotella sp.]